MKKLIITSIIFTLLALSHAVAQTPTSQPSKEEQEKARVELERKVLSLLEEIVSDSQMLKLADNRAIVQATAADLLWPRDEKRARTYFRDALTTIGNSLSNEPQQDATQVYGYWMLLQLRHQLLRMVARRDPQLALDLLQATRPPMGNDSAQGRMLSSRYSQLSEEELALEQSLAVEAAANDPKRALQMAEDSLSKGVSYSLAPLLRKLQQKDADAAQRLAVDIIKKLQTENLSQNPSASFVAQDLLRNALRPQEATLGAKEQAIVAQAKPLNLDDQAKRDLANIIARAALSQTTDTSILLSIQPLLPDLEKLVPERAEQLRKRVADAQKMLDPRAKQWMEYEPLMQNGTTDAILDAAQKAPPEMRNGLYNVAAWKLAQAGDLERARQIINDNVSGPEREQSLAMLDRRLIARAIEQGKLDEAKQLIARTPSKQARVAQIALLAMALAKKGERKLALELLAETKNLINTHPENQQEINTLLIVARAYADVEPARAFELIEPLVDEANDMISAAALLDKFSTGQKFFRKDEMVLQPGFITANVMFTQYAKELGALARADFNRTKAVADRFQRNEVRLMARLLIAQSILSDRPMTGEADENIFGTSFGISVGGSSFFSEY